MGDDTQSLYLGLVGVKVPASRESLPGLQLPCSEGHPRSDAVRGDLLTREFPRIPLVAGWGQTMTPGVKADVKVQASRYYGMA